MTDITPIKSTTAGSVTIDGTVITGTQNIKFGDSSVMKDITTLGDPAKKNAPTIQEWKLSFDTLVQKSDAGQVKLRTAKVNGTRYVYVINITSGMYYTCEGGYVESIDYDLSGAEDFVKASVNIASYGTATLTTT